MQLKTNRHSVFGSSPPSCEQVCLLLQLGILNLVCPSQRHPSVCRHQDSAAASRLLQKSDPEYVLSPNESDILPFWAHSQLKPGIKDKERAQLGLSLALPISVVRPHNE